MVHFLQGTSSGIRTILRKHAERSGWPTVLLTQSGYAIAYYLENLLV